MSADQAIVDHVGPTFDQCYDIVLAAQGITWLECAE